ncbi:MAG TPA: V-type ATP synthase subunit E family protein [Clostridia bacterium]|nr:V-type ATP synthase subunit E family protein [Clostridia bacterium]
MSGIDRITEKIINQAELQAGNRISYAEEEAKKAMAGLEKRFERTLEHELKKAEDQGRENAGRIIANARLEGRKKKLAARQDTVKQVFDLVAERLSNLPAKDYMEFLCNLALPVLDEEENSIILNEKDRKAIGKDLTKMLSEKSSGRKVVLSDETARTIGGLIVKSGDIQTNLTLESILRLEREKLESDVVGILFGSE